MNIPRRVQPFFARRTLSAFATLLLLASTASAIPPAFQLDEGDVVAFLGGTNMRRLIQSGHLEAQLTKKFAKAKPKFCDLTWEADTIYRQGTEIERWRKDGFGGLEEQLEQLGVTHVIMQFGQLESMDGPARLDEFREAFGRFVTQLSKKQKRTIVVLTPTPFEDTANPHTPKLRTTHLTALQQYSKVVAECQTKYDCILVGIGGAYPQPITSNGVHVRPEMQSVIAGRVARVLLEGDDDRAQLAVDFDAARQSNGIIHTELEPLRQAILEKNRLWYDYWRPANWKLLYGDDSKRVFTRVAEGSPHPLPFRDEWKQLKSLIVEAEDRVHTIANGGKDPGDNRPEPEVLHGVAEADVEAELAAFETLPEMQVNLFASEEHGITSPLAVRWDTAGRMYVSTSTTYPHVFPGDVPNDKIIRLEDTDQDGIADKSMVFANGLNIPTAMEVADGGIYVGQNTEMLFLKDTDGDGVADHREVVLAGFGNGDSHQTINSFCFSPGGELYMGQGDGIESRVETPWGVTDIFMSGFARYQPLRQRLIPLLDDCTATGNAWGTAFDGWGQAFSVDGAGGVNYLTPGLVPCERGHRIKRIGDPGGYCGLGFVDGRGLPDELQNNFVTGDYKQNRVKRFVAKPEGGGFDVDWKKPLLQSRHRNFRPVDVQVGPDGAIYVVDWYNPITCHQDDEYRHPNRDKAHGRIWRVSWKKAPQDLTPSDLTKAPITRVLDELKSPEHWARYQAKRELTTRAIESKESRAQIVTALDTWIVELDVKHADYEHHLFEALASYATIEEVKPRLLLRMLASPSPHARAFAARVAGRWQDRLDHPLPLIESVINDGHPLVRMEAINACGQVPSADAVTVAAKAVDSGIDEWQEYALRQTSRHLAAHWKPALAAGELAFASPAHTAAVLKHAGSKDTRNAFRKIIDDGTLGTDARIAAIKSLLSVGDDDVARDYGLDQKRFTIDGKYDSNTHAAVLDHLVSVAQAVDLCPNDHLDEFLMPLLEQNKVGVRSAALHLARIWDYKAAKEVAAATAKDEALPATVRAAAFAAMAKLNAEDAKSPLTDFSSRGSNNIRAAATNALAEVDVPSAAKSAVELINKGTDPAQLLPAFLKRNGGVQALASAFANNKPQANVAEQVVRALFKSGRSDPELLGVLNEAIGVSVKTPDHSEDHVNRLARQAAESGDFHRGSVVFKSLACNSCHKVAGNGGSVGPNLSAIGTTLAPERIIEEVLWPNRQIKEGYTVLQVVTNDGKILQGYERVTRETKESGDLILEDVSTGKRTRIGKDDVDETAKMNSAMPEHLTGMLSEAQLADLIRYLSDLGKLQ